MSVYIKIVNAELNERPPSPVKILPKLGLPIN